MSAKQVAPATPPPTVGSVIKTADGVTVTTTKAPRHSRMPKPNPGDRVTLHYIGTLRESGKMFDSSRAKGKPFEFTCGKGEVIRGWEQAILHMHVSQRATWYIPSNMAYGNEGAGRINPIPPNADLIFDVELLGINHILIRNDGDGDCDDIASLFEKCEIL